MSKNIVLLSLGGTISARGRDETDLKDYVSGLVSGEELLKEIPQVSKWANVHPLAIDQVSSTEINEEHWVSLRETLEHYLIDGDFDGAVITQGTNTIEETAYFLHLTMNTNKPIILVGAQRPFTALSTDVHLNLLNAFQVASDPRTKRQGVIVLLNNELHSARDVTKGQTYRLQAFHSGDFGLLGVIDGEQNVEYYRQPIRKHTITSDFSKMSLSINQFPKVEIVYSYAGATNFLIDQIVQSGEYAGIVVAGTGAGRFSKTEELALIEARKQGLHVVRSSRVGKGRVVPIDAYNNLEFINGDNLIPQKARILLMLALMKYERLVDIQKVFLAH